MNLYDKFLKIKQDTSSVTTNPLLNAIDLQFIKTLEAEKKHDWNIDEIYQEIDKSMCDIKIEDIATFTGIYTKYGEAKFYMLLKSKDNLSIEVIPEEKASRIKTPDFKIEYNSKIFYGEVKSLIMAGGDLKYETIMKEGLDARIEAEKDIKKGKGVGCGMQVIQPHLKTNSNYDPYSIRLIIERLIDKFCNNYKEGQYLLGDTISLIYLNAHNFPLYGFGNVKEKIIPYYFDKMRNSPVSGELWIAAFSNVGMLAFKSPEFPGAKNIDGVINRVGILNEYPKIKAICFYIESLNSDEYDVVALLRYYEDDSLYELISVITDLHNNDLNTEYYRLLI